MNIIADDTEYGPGYNRSTGAPRPFPAPPRGTSEAAMAPYEQQIALWLFGREPAGMMETLQTRITARSITHNWAVVVGEWDFRFSASSAGPQTGQRSGQCLCRHEIQEHVHIQNCLNGWISVVGNCCIKKFMGFNAEPIIGGFKKIRKDPTKSMPSVVCDFAVVHGWLDDQQIDFIKATTKKRKLPPEDATTPLP
ncbi:hypothetical protein [Rhodopila sp.]|uniref:hypothetical protein n=1 Tax=Rhodopila sp. TaxID=2480087 RepID=UPI003D13C3B2